MFNQIEDLITKHRWKLSLSVPTLVSINSIWKLVEPDVLVNILLTLATLGLLSKGSIPTDINKEKTNESSTNIKS